MDISKLTSELEQVLSDLQATASLTSEHLLVIGCSTSEIIGQRIGTAGTMEVAAAIYEALVQFQKTTGVMLAFQGCEHINRALLVEKQTAQKFGYEPVAVIPVRGAGGAMTEYAYQQMKEPVVVEFIKADAGIDIGDTFIGMHLKHVAVPVRSKVKTIGEAHVTLATTRPKLIGGERAVYKPTAANKSCT